MNRLVRSRLSIITPKKQTTRQRVQGIITTLDHQIIFLDTPGILRRSNKLHDRMMESVVASLEGVDLVLYMMDSKQTLEDLTYLPLVQSNKLPFILLVNKVDLMGEQDLKRKEDYLKRNTHGDPYMFISALKGTNLDTLYNQILLRLPQHPAYYPPDALTDKQERFFVNEIVREKIFLHCHQEIPYSSSVVTDAFHDSADLIRIEITIFVERETQKGILIGKKGYHLKRVVTAARKDLESFFAKKVFLQTRVRVEKNWRNSPRSLRKFGYTL